MAHIFIRLEDKQKDEILKAIDLMNFNNDSNESLNNVARKLLSKWAKKYLRNL